MTLRVASLLTVLALASPARADENLAGGDAMAAWRPPVVRADKKDRQEIMAAMKKMEDASKKGDLDAAAAMIDFPVLMISDNSKGDGGGSSWSREQWTAVMKPFYEKPMPEVTMTTGKPIISLVTDSLAAIHSPWTMKMNGKKLTGSNAVLLVRKGGVWKVKAMMEGGWGDMPMPEAAPTGQAKDP